jgi:hypothetical protein
MGQWCPPLYGKSSFYAKKRTRALAKIAKLQAVVAECDKAIAEAQKNAATPKN